MLSALHCTRPSSLCSEACQAVALKVRKSQKEIVVKFIYFEKATPFCEISTVALSYVVPVKSTVEISQNFVAFPEYMKFTVTAQTIAKH